MFAIIDWQTKSLVTEEGTDRIQLFNTEHRACTYARANLHEGLWSVVEVPDSAMFFIE